MPTEFLTAAYVLGALQLATVIGLILVIRRPRINQEDLTQNLTEGLRAETTLLEKSLRTEMSDGMRMLSDGLSRQLKDGAEAVQRHVESLSKQVSERLKETGEAQVSSIGALKMGLETSFGAFETRITGKFDELQKAVSDAAERQGKTTKDAFEGFEKRSTSLLQGIETSQKERLEAVNKSTDALLKSVNDRFQAFEQSQQGAAKQLADRLGQQLTGMSEQLGSTQKERLEVMTKAVAELGQMVERKQKELLDGVNVQLGVIAEKSEKKLEEMRQTVDEKLQGTLEQRLGVHFTKMNEAFERMHTSMGEMRTMAKDVEGLQRTLSNVKSRGIIGEVQCQNILEDILTPDQWARNVRTKPDSHEVVEYALKIPNRGSDDHTWLVIDAKFPIEDYNRLLTAVEANDSEGIEAASKQIEHRVRMEAKKIADKYINVPTTMEYGILFLPNEGLFAEVMRRPGLVQKIQQECRVTIVGPTLLGAHLMAVRAFYRDMAIEKRSAEVWETLSAVSTEFANFGKSFALARRKLGAVDKAFDDIDVRTRAMERKLRGVTSLPEAAASKVLQLEMPKDDGEEYASGESCDYP